MTGPQAYAEWLPLLDRFRSGDDSALSNMQHGSIEWTNVVAERWVQQLAETLDARLQNLSGQLNKDLERSRGDCFAISNALLSVRRALTPLRVFVAMPAIPAETQEYLGTELTRWAERSQKSLECVAKGVRHDQGRLLKTIRDHSLTTSLDVAPVNTVESVREGILPPGRGRRVLL